MAQENHALMSCLDQVDPEKPVLIAGPTASGKSALAMAVARVQGGVIVNADALQVYGNWRVLSARPSAADEAELPHRLYGHVVYDHAYSVGEWLREVAAILQTGERAIIVGGTGLYLTALTEGLAEIPPTPPKLREQANARLAQDGLAALLTELDADTLSRIDTQNPMRVQRAWEVQHATGRGMAAWQDDTPPPILPRSQAECLVVDAPKEWLNPRIELRFDLMLDQGALDEARANLATWSSDLPSSKAIGAPELIAHLQGDIDLNTARERSIIATRQFAKRQRTWFRARMKTWRQVSAPDLKKF